MKVTKHTPEPVEPTFTIEGLTQEEMDYLTSCAYYCGTPGTDLSVGVHAALVNGGRGGSKTLSPEEAPFQAHIWQLA